MKPSTVLNPRASLRGRNESLMRFEFKKGVFEFPRKYPVIFGILNITPDSFSDGGMYLSPENALDHALQLERDGADAIDVGGESTRPSATAISADEEINRALPIIQTLKKYLKIPISIDTTKASVAEAALAEGAGIINDISGLTADPRMASVVASSRAGLILMHSRGTPRTMQTLCNYQNVIKEVLREITERMEYAFANGVSRSQIAIDPGIGFAKNAEQSRLLLQHLKAFTSPDPKRHFLSHPVLIGISRKSFLGGEIKDRGPATLAAELQAHQQGIHMIRTHDVAAIQRALATQTFFG